MTVVGVGAAVVAITGTTILGSVYAVALPPPAASTTVVTLPTDNQRLERIELPSRNSERLTPAATPTGMVTSTPTPTPSPTPVADDTAQEQPPVAPTASPAGKTGVGDGSIPAVLLCIRTHESGDGQGSFNYQAFNGIEHYGAYQLSATYSDDWARRYGYPEWAGVTADQWPPEVQDAVAIALFNDSPQLWSTYEECA